MKKDVNKLRKYCQNIFWDSRLDCSVLANRFYSAKSRESDLAKLQLF